MTTLIHPTAIIDPTAQLGENVQIGPYSIVHKDAVIGDNTVLSSHVVVEERTIIGQNCQISSGAVLGGAPQDLSYKNEPTRARIGDNCIIRECVTVNRGSSKATGETVMGDNCFLMAYSHLGHDVAMGNHVILANAVQLAGHVEVDDYAFIGGSSVVHQFCRVGKMSMIGGFSASRQDVPPFALTDGKPCAVQGINIVGLRRRGFNAEQRQRMKKAFYYLWFAGLNRVQAIEAIQANLEVDASIQELIDFMQSSKRGVISGVSRRQQDEKPVDSASESEPALV